MNPHTLDLALNLKDTELLIDGMKKLIYETGYTDLTINKDMAALTDRILKLRKQIKESAW